jgi:hypothetical protein
MGTGEILCNTTSVLFITLVNNKIVFAINYQSNGGNLTLITEYGSITITLRK